MRHLQALLDEVEHTRRGYRYGYLDESAKRDIRRAIVKAICIPGHQVPFPSREMPVGRGWGSGGLQVTLAVVTPEDVVKVIDQGDDESLNARALRGLVADVCSVATTTAANEATLIQTRHRIPEAPLREGQLVVFQVPIADPLRTLTASSSETRRMHAEGAYEGMWTLLYEDLARHGAISHNAGYPVIVEERYLATPSPIPKWDVGRLDDAPFLSLFGAGRERVIFAFPPYTRVRPQTFADVPFAVERFEQPCARCGTRDAFLVEQQVDGASALVCSDTDWCRSVVEGDAR
jgi:alpha-D-ribose 1-methylphosphonate 5-phosphate C-P lyase